MNLRITTWLLLAWSVAGNAQSAKDILQRTYQAHGGAAWDTVNYIHSHQAGHRNWLEQSENPDGPYITTYDDCDELRSVNYNRIYRKGTQRMLISNDVIPFEEVLRDTTGMMVMQGYQIPMQPSAIHELQNWKLYSPELLLRAARSHEATLLPTATLQGIPHDVVQFKRGDDRITLYINRYTSLLAEAHIETFMPEDIFFSVWGVFVTRIQYTVYSLNPGGIVYPLQWDIYRNGRLFREVAFSSVRFTASAPDSLFSIPATVTQRKQPARLVRDTPLPVNKIIELSPGIFTIPGSWYTGWVEQEDGIIIIEAPIHSQYSAQLLQEVHKRYPGKKIKGVVVSSDAWPHLAGVREYYANNVPVYSHFLNEGILTRVAAADYSRQPDSFHTSKTKPRLVLVDKSITLADKRNPMIITPVQGEGGERMLAVYFPNQKILYASDLIQYYRNEFFFIEYVNEVQNLIHRNNWTVNTVYAMHTAPMPWSVAEEALRKIFNPTKP